MDDFADYAGYEDDDYDGIDPAADAALYLTDLAVPSLNPLDGTQDWTDPEDRW